MSHTFSSPHSLSYNRWAVAQSLPAPTPEAAAASQDVPTAPQEVPAAPQELPAATQDAPAAAEAPAARDAPVSEVQRRSEDEPVAQHPGEPRVPQELTKADESVVPTVKLIPPPAPLQRHQQGSDGDGDGDGDVEMAEVPPKVSTFNPYLSSSEHLRSLSASGSERLRIRELPNPPSARLGRRDCRPRPQGAQMLMGPVQPSPPLGPLRSLSRYVLII